MKRLQLRTDLYSPLNDAFGERLQTGVILARYTAARLGGAADAFVEVQSIDDLVKAVKICWEHEIPFVILGGGSNVLVSDRGVCGLVILNKAKRIRFDEISQIPTVWTESGANLGLVSRQAAHRGLSGLEWAAAIPGTIGGAVVGNAGAHGENMAGNLILAEILHREYTDAGDIYRCEEWPVENFSYTYRSSILKQQPGRVVVLTALLKLQTGNSGLILEKMDELAAYRKRTQPPGASMGSMFKNPPGDYAGRLIEAAGLKGSRQGNVQISTVHANFFVNDGRARAADVYKLIKKAQAAVLEQFGVEMELEIELIGDWHQAGLDE
ncbi:MAG TPA: UDP-N-acetylmuramate dehydrogenase [Anaerolineales bacterium]|nr:UDP-N-acetylmuramate dehydrogenase [Anaerolineales bacterium]